MYLKVTVRENRRESPSTKGYSETGEKCIKITELTIIKYDTGSCVHNGITFIKKEDKSEQSQSQHVVPGTKVSRGQWYIVLEFKSRKILLVDFLIRVSKVSKEIRIKIAEWLLKYEINANTVCSLIFNKICFPSIAQLK